MKIYTKTGDNGQTSLYGGKRVGKDSQRIKAYGDIDELNAILGLCSSLHVSKNAGNMAGNNSIGDLRGVITALQRQLYIVGADLSAHLPIKTERINKNHTIALEKYIDKLDSKLPPLKNFIVPGVNVFSSYLHLARTVCRRAEREVVALGRKEKINPQLIPYLNRLSDLLFVMARRASKTLKEKKFIAAKNLKKSKKP